MCTSEECSFIYNVIHVLTLRLRPHADIILTNETVGAVTEEGAFQVGAELLQTRARQGGLPALVHV